MSYAESKASGGIRSSAGTESGYSPSAIASRLIIQRPRRSSGFNFTYFAKDSRALFAGSRCVWTPPSFSGNTQQSPLWRTMQFCTSACRR